MNIGFVSTRLAGTDGVTLETIKWARICRDLGHNAFFCAGQLDPEIQPGTIVPEAHFAHPEVVALQQKCFGTHTRTPVTTDQLHDLRRRLKGRHHRVREEILPRYAGSAKRRHDPHEPAAGHGADRVHR